MKISRKNGLFFPVVSAVVFAAVVLWLVLALANTRSVERSQGLATVRESVENGITLCYAIEGAYPQSIDYLRENYGVVYDPERYIVHYECFAANIRPDVTVIEKAGNNEGI